MRSSLRPYLRWARTGLGPVALGTRRFSSADQAAFATAANHTTGRHVRVLAVSLGALNLLYGLTDPFVFRDAPALVSIFDRARLALSALALCAFFASRLFPGHQRAVGMTFGPLGCLLSGYVAGDLGGPGTPFLHLQYYLLFGPVMIWLPPLRRLGATLGWALALCVGYFGPHPAYLRDPLALMCLVYLPFIALLSVLAGAFTDLALVRAFALRLDAAAQAARHGERLHLARELHDELGQELTALRYALRLMARRVEREHAALRPNVEQLFGLLDHTGATLRALLTDLRVQPLEGQRLCSAAADLIATFRARTGVAATLQADPGADAADPEAGAAALRVLREALTNVARHADAGAVTVALERDAAGLVLRVRDDGVGGAAPRPGGLEGGGGFGLVGMYEQAERVGGALSIDSEPGRGTTVTLRVPEGGA